MNAAELKVVEAMNTETDDARGLNYDENLLW